MHDFIKCTFHLLEKSIIFFTYFWTVLTDIDLEVLGGIQVLKLIALLPNTLCRYTNDKTFKWEILMVAEFIYSPVSVLQIPQVTMSFWNMQFDLMYIWKIFGTFPSLSNLKFQKGSLTQTKLHI